MPRLGKCLLDLEMRRMTALSGEDIPLRAGEFELLRLFAENPNRPLSRDWLLETTSHREMDPFDRAIDMHLSNLRKKLPERTDGQPRFKTVRGRGYLWLEQA